MFHCKIRAAALPAMLVGALAITLTAGCASTGDTGPSNAGSTSAADTTEGGPIASPGATLVVHGMGCPLCANNLDLELAALDGVTAVLIDLGSGQVQMGVAPGARVARSAIASTVEDAGFTLKSIDQNTN